jgi:hypothetical protein
VDWPAVPRDSKEPHFNARFPRHRICLFLGLTPRQADSSVTELVPMNPPFWVPFVAAAATLLAALVALFKEDVVKMWRRPDLRIRMSLSPPDCARMPVIVNYMGANLNGPPSPKTWQGYCYFFRLWVENKGDFAERVQVYVKPVSYQMGDGRSESVPEFIPMNLSWADSPDPGKPIIFESINPSMGRYCDFAAVSEPANPTETIREGMTAGESTLNLQTQVSPSTQGNRLKPGSYRIEILVAASNAKPKPFAIDLEWKGRYIDEPLRMFGESIRIRISG